MIVLFVQLYFILHHTHYIFVILLYFLEYISAPKISFFALSHNYNCNYIINLGMLVPPKPLLHHIHAKLVSNLDAI